MKGSTGVSIVSRAGRRFRKTLLLPPEARALNRLERLASRTARRTPGVVQLDGYTIRFADALTLCPQWRDIFVRRTLDATLHPSNPRILDCGAHVGLASLFFKRSYPGARIDAYEADPALADLLRVNLATNGAGDVAVHDAAVWIEHGTIPFRPDGADAGAIEAVASDSSDRPVSMVPAVRLRDLLSDRVDLLKLDIEGAEAAVLADALPALCNVRTMIIEVHEFDVASPRLPVVLSCLKQAGFLWALDELYVLPWMKAKGENSPFPGAPSCHVVRVRAWRPADPQ